MRILLDTNVLLWWLGDEGAPLSAKAAKIIESDENEIYFSAVNVWEVAIKKGLGRIDIDMSEFEQKLAKTGFESLSVTLPHAFEVERLPNHHKDPFDRMLVAQSRVEPMRLLTHDQVLVQYGNHIILA